MPFETIKKNIFNTLNSMRERNIYDPTFETSELNRYLEAVDILDIHMSTLFDTCDDPIDEIAFAYTTSMIYKELLEIQKIANEFCDQEFINIIESASQELFINALG